MTSTYYRSIRQQIGQSLLLVPGVAGLVHDSEGRLLLQQKADGSWSLPAGAIEPGETPEQAMARELHEETGLNAQQLSLIDCFGGREFRHQYPDGNQVEYVILLFKCFVTNLALAPVDSETVNLQFFSKEQFPGLALPYPIDLLFE